MRGRELAWLILLIARVAGAEPRIVLVELRDAPALPTLRSQVELHAGRRASVRTVTARDLDPMSYGERASQLIASGEATVVVWIARVDRGYLVFAAGGWPGRALVELVHVGADIGDPEIERTIALKIAGLLDVVLAPGISAGAALGVAGAEPRARWRIEITGAVVREPHERGRDGRIAFGASRAWRGAGWTIAPGLAGYWQPQTTVERDRGRASITELGGVVAIEAGRASGPVQLFARPRFVAAVVAAAGTSNDGRHGDATVLAPYVGLEAGIGRAVSDTVSLGVVAGCDVALIHHELVIDGATIVDLGRLRLHVGISLTVAL